MAIRKSSISGTPFGDTSSRPSSPAVGQTYYNGELGYQEIYTAAGWIPASGGNDFNLNIGGTYTTITFSQSYASGSYSIVSNNNDTTIDIYAYAADGSLAGYSSTKSFTATQRFNKMVVIGGTAGDVLTFTYKTTYATTNTTSEVTSAAWITSVGTSSLPNQNNTTVITGGNFATNVVVTFTGTDNVERNAKSVTRSSATSITATRPDDMPVAYSPYTVKVVNPDVVNLPVGTNFHILSNAITVGASPVWSTAASLPNFTKDVSYSTTIVATDADAGSSISYSIVSGSLPSGLSLNSSNGVISGTPTVSGTYTFTVRATDSGSNFVDRAFTTLQALSNPPTINSVSDVGTSRAYNNGAVSVSFSAPEYSGTTSITSYTVTASTGQTATGSSSPLTVAGIATGATPTFTMTATNSAGTSLSSSASSSVTVTTVPGAPTIGTATRTANDTVSLTFTAPTLNGGKAVTSYVTATSPSVTTTTTGSSSPVTVTGAFAGGQSYSFQIAAVNQNGTSAYSSSSNSIIVTFPEVSGGALTSDATYYYRAFTSTGTISTTSSLSAEALIVAGGAGGSGRSSTRYGSNIYGGGGGAGGMKSVSLTLPAGSTTITIGSGGSGTSPTVTGGNGSGSVVGSIATCTGGGGGGTGNGPANGNNGGSGGGSGGWSQYKVGNASGNGGSGIAGEGNAGGSSYGGGGGGKGSAASGGTAGSPGTIWSFTGAAGGAGSGSTAGTANSGTGGAGSGSNNVAGASGGSGYVVIRYLRSAVGG